MVHTLRFPHRRERLHSLAISARRWFSITIATAADLTLNRLVPHDFGVIFGIRGVWDAVGQFGKKTRTTRRVVFFEMRNTRGHARRINRLAAIVKV
jgi:hypothetical protein